MKKKKSKIIFPHEEYNSLAGHQGCEAFPNCDKFPHKCILLADDFEHMMDKDD